MPSTLWTDSFFPRSRGEFIGNSEAVEASMNWAASWAKGRPQKPLLLHGSTGTGKTALAYLVASLHNWELFEMNASDFRNKEAVEHFAGAASQNASFSGKLRLVLIDEIDGLQGVEDRGGVGAVSSVLKEARNPIMLTANSAYDPKLRALRSACDFVEFKKINYLSIAKRLREIMDAQNILYDPEAVKLIAQNSEGDFRSALLDAQTLAMEQPITQEAVKTMGARDRQANIFKVLGQIFNANDIETARKARDSSEAPLELLERWIEENIPRHFTEPRDTAAAFERLSRADIFNGRIRRRQHYGFLRYSAELMTSGVALSRSREYTGWTSYQFPQLLSKLSRSKPVRELRRGIAEKIARSTHSGIKEVIAHDLPYIKMAAQQKKNIIELAACFELSPEEIAWLLDTKPETKKVEAIATAAQELRAKSIAEHRKQISALYQTQHSAPEMQHDAPHAHRDAQTSLHGL